MSDYVLKFWGIKQVPFGWLFCQYICAVYLLSVTSKHFQMILSTLTQLITRLQAGSWKAYKIIKKLEKQKCTWFIHK